MRVAKRNPKAPSLSLAFADCKGLLVSGPRPEGSHWQKMACRNSSHGFLYGSGTSTQLRGMALETRFGGNMGGLSDSHRIGCRAQQTLAPYLCHPYKRPPTHISSPSGEKWKNSNGCAEGTVAWFGRISRSLVEFARAVYLYCTNKALAFDHHCTE